MNQFNDQHQSERGTEQQFNRRAFLSTLTVLTVPGYLRLHGQEVAAESSASLGTNPRIPSLSGMNPDRLLLDRASFLTQPNSLYCFHNIEKLGFRQDVVQKGSGVLPLKEPNRDFECDYVFNGKRSSLSDYVNNEFVLGYLVLHDSEIVVERYRHGSGRSSRFLSNSVAKSLLSVLIGIAIDEGKIRSVESKVTDYVPAFRGSGFEQATIRHLLEMTAGVTWDEEDYLKPTCDFGRYLAALVRGTPSLRELSLALKSKTPPGESFQYQSISTQVLCAVLEAATGKRLNKFLSEKVWSLMGAESDAFYYAGERQSDISAAAGLNATLRDYGRFGLMVLNGGTLNGHRIVPEAWIRKSTSPTTGKLLPKAAESNDSKTAENQGYAFHWWTNFGSDASFMAEGIFGQAIYVNPARRVVIAQNSAWPEPDHLPRFDQMIKLMETVAKVVAPV